MGKGVIIEDELSRTRDHREFRKDRIKHMKRLGAPSALIEREELKATMTYTQHKNWLIEQANLDTEANNEYAKYNPMDPEVVDELFKRYDKLAESFNGGVASSMLFNMALKSRDLMSQEDWDNCLYDPLIESLYNQYNEKYKKEMDEYYV